LNGGLMRTGEYMNVPTQYWIPRIQVMFKAENPNVVARRIAEAHKRRALTEALLRYNLYVDCMPTDGLGELDPSSMKRMIRISKHDTPVLKHKKGLDDVLSSLEKEVNMDYLRSMNVIIIERVVKENPQLFRFITLPGKEERLTPYRATVEIPKFDFDKKFDEFAFHSLLTRAEAIQAVCKTQYECMEVRNKSLFQVPLTKHMRIEEFEQTQAQATL
jgi:dynein heavy chain, axonemal